MLTDVEILTADLAVEDPATGSMGWTSEEPASGYPLATRPTATTDGAAALTSLLASLEAQDVFIQANAVAFRTTVADIATTHSGRWITYSAGTEVRGDYTATCSGNGQVVKGRFHGWQGPSDGGELDCSLVAGLPSGTLAQRVANYCSANTRP